MGDQTIERGRSDAVENLGSKNLDDLANEYDQVLGPGSKSFTGFADSHSQNTGFTFEVSGTTWKVVLARKPGKNEKTRNFIEGMLQFKSDWITQEPGHWNEDTKSVTALKDCGNLGKLRIEYKGDPKEDSPEKRSVAILYEGPGDHFKEHFMTQR